MNDARFAQTLEYTSEALRAIDLALFAAASGDHNPLHLDEQVAQQAGFERPLVHGMLTMAHAGRMFTQAFGPGSVQALQTRFTGTVQRGERLRMRAVLSSVEDGAARYSIEVAAGDGKPVATGMARIRPLHP